MRNTKHKEGRSGMVKEVRMLAGLRGGTSEASRDQETLSQGRQVQKGTHPAAVVTNPSSIAESPGQPLDKERSPTVFSGILIQ